MNACSSDSSASWTDLYTVEPVLEIRGNRNDVGMIIHITPFKHNYVATHHQSHLT